MDITPTQKEIQRVVCAACRYDGIIVVGIRHLDKLMRQTMKMMYPNDDRITHKFAREQGFVDQFGNFLTREEALMIAKKKSQFYRRCGGDEKQLYSENLY